MGIIDKFSATSSASSDYTELTDSDLTDSSSNSSSVVFCDVRSQNDLIKGKEGVNEGNVVVFDISYIESNGLSLDNVFDEIQETTTSVNGDVVHKQGNDIIIATPRDINIERNKL